MGDGNLGLVPSLQSSVSGISLFLVLQVVPAGGRSRGHTHLSLSLSESALLWEVAFSYPFAGGAQAPASVVVPAHRLGPLW